MYTPKHVRFNNLDIIDYIMNTCKRGEEYYMIKHEFIDEDKIVFHKYSELEDFIIWLDNHSPYYKHNIKDVRIYDQSVIVFYE